MIFMTPLSIFHSISRRPSTNHIIAPFILKYNGLSSTNCVALGSPEFSNSETWSDYKSFNSFNGCQALSIQIHLRSNHSRLHTEQQVESSRNSQHSLARTIVNQVISLLSYKTECQLSNVTNLYHCLLTAEYLVSGIMTSALPFRSTLSKSKWLLQIKVIVTQTSNSRQNTQSNCCSHQIEVQQSHQHHCIIHNIITVEQKSPKSLYLLRPTKASLLLTAIWSSQNSRSSWLSFTTKQMCTLYPAGRLIYIAIVSYVFKFMKQKLKIFK